MWTRQQRRHLPRCIGLFDLRQHELTDGTAVRQYDMREKFFFKFGDTGFNGLQFGFYDQ